MECGWLNGYIPPRAREALSINFRELQLHRVECDPKAGSYIPIPVPLKAELFTGTATVSSKV